MRRVAVLVSAALTAMALETSRPGDAAAQAPSFLTQWGSGGSGNGQFNQPIGIALDAGGNVFVSDLYNARVQRFSATGVYLGAWPMPSPFSGPAGIVFDTDGNLYVADTFRNQVIKFGPDGGLIAGWTTSGAMGGYFRLPWALAMGAGHLYESELENLRVQSVTLDGDFVTQWGGGGGGFSAPYGIAFGPDGNVYVADLGNHCIQVFTGSGSFLRMWGTYGSGSGELDQPYGLAFDAMGRIYVTDKGNHRVEVFTVMGAFVGQWGSLGSGPGQFDAPTGIAVDAAGNVFVADAAQNRIQKFGSIPTATLQRTWGALKALYRGTGE